MTTKQFSQLVNIAIRMANIPTGYIKTINNTTTFNYSGNSAHTLICGSFNNFSSTYYEWDAETPSSTLNAGFIVAGSGSTPASKSDYCLESPYSTTVAREITKSVSNGSNAPELTLPYRLYTSSIANISDNDIVVKEIGFICQIGGNSYLVTRDVLENPVTIPAGGTKEFSIKINW